MRTTGHWLHFTSGIDERSISLGVDKFPANTERFQGLVPLLTHLCPLTVPEKVRICSVLAGSRENVPERY